jgi:DNA-binding transcriptional regulator YdaS (Cro superfamily)
LKSGEYESIAGARRGLGRAKITIENKERLAKMIDRHFGVSDKAEKPKKDPKAPKKAAKKAAPVQVSAKADKPEAWLTALQRISRAKKPGRKPRAVESASVETEHLQRIQVAHTQVSAITDAIKAIKMCKEMNPGLDQEKISRGTKDGSDALVKILAGIRSSLGLDSNGPAVNPRYSEDASPAQDTDEEYPVYQPSPLD